MYTFLDEYREVIVPKIQEIDVFLQEQDEYCAGCVAKVLSLCEDEVLELLKDAGLKAIGRQSFMSIMQKGSSRICQLYAREVSICSPPTYNCTDIAYVYSLDLDVVENAFQKLKIKEATVLTMPLEFANIPY